VDANMMYSYVGDTFRSNVAEELTGVYTLADRITGWLIVTDGFVPRLTAYTQDVTPGLVSYSFTDGHQTLTQANSTGAFALAVHPYVAIDLNCCWSVFINTPTSGITTTMSSDRYDHAWIGADNVGGNSLRADSARASDARPSGRWADRPGR